MTVAIEMHRALEKKYSEAVGVIEEIMRSPMTACKHCEKYQKCGMNGTDCVPVWKGRRQ